MKGLSPSMFAGGLHYDRVRQGGPVVCNLLAMSELL